MLNQLHSGAGLIDTVERDDIRVEVPEPLYAKESAACIREAHGDFFFFIKSFFEVLNVKYQALVCPFGG